MKVKSIKVPKRVEGGLERGNLTFSQHKITLKRKEYERKAENKVR
jgi:hypothetical protein